MGSDEKEKDSSKNSDKQKSRLEELTSVRKDVKINEGYTRFVKRMRVVFPLVALILLAVVMLWPEMRKKPVAIEKAKLLPDSKSIKNELVNPHFESRDREKQPFSIDASKATQSQKTPDIVNLENPGAKITRNDGSTVSVKAQSGTYKQKTEELFLKDGVVLSQSDDYILETDEISMDMDKKISRSDSDVRVVLPNGEITAKGLEMSGKNNSLIFKGPAKLTLKGIEAAGIAGKPESEEK